MIKISFLGDILCEEPFLNAAKREDGTFDFSRAFEGIKALCADSDYVVGNLETPLTDEQKDYTHEMYSFNTPDSFVDAIREAGVSAVLTANNHCGDRGLEGLKRTVRILDGKGFPHTGTFSDERSNEPIKVEINGSRLAFISCTAAINNGRTKPELTEKHINLLSTQTLKDNAPAVIRIKRAIKKIIGAENVMRIKISLGKPPKNISVDDQLDQADTDRYLRDLRVRIQKLKDEGYLVFVCPHMGGQFNVYPGAFSEYVMEFLSRAGADAVIAAHPHIAQKAELKNGVPCFYSIGNVTMSMSTLYILRENIPEIGLMTHFYIEGQQIKKVTYSLLYQYEDAHGYAMVRPVADVLKDAAEADGKALAAKAERIVRRVKQDDSIAVTIEDEFDLFNF